jgi:hypothetical protein
LVKAKRTRHVEVECFRPRTEWCGLCAEYVVAVVHDCLKKSYSGKLYSKS